MYDKKKSSCLSVLMGIELVVSVFMKIEYTRTNHWIAYALKDTFHNA